MASEFAIRATGLGKRYMIGSRAETEQYSSLRDVIARRARGLVTSLTAPTVEPHRRQSAREEFWALRDLNFAINQGDVVGIIGRNGAGKSTLLKILSRITEPSEGRIEIVGRVASLLEVGTGFHPELTGRENIFLNGAVLGMSRLEIKRKFDQIVDFSGVERFLDTPVKRYSSGMYVRLAFAVAAHLEPEILIVDEVLAVGDAEFQRKCLGKMKDVAGEGRTVLFVSHNLASLSALTSKSILLHNGTIVATGPTSDVIAQYLSGQRMEDCKYERNDSEHVGPHLKFADVITSSGGPVHESLGTLRLRFGVWLPSPKSNVCFSFQIRNAHQVAVVHGFHYSPEMPPLPAGLSILTCTLDRARLNVGDYYLTSFLSEPPGGVLWETIDEICPFRVVRTDTNPYWGWRSDACTYFEDCQWSVDVAATSRVGELMND